MSYTKRVPARQRASYDSPLLTTTPQQEANLWGCRSLVSGWPVSRSQVLAMSYCKEWIRNVAPTSRSGRRRGASGSGCFECGVRFRSHGKGIYFLLPDAIAPPFLLRLASWTHFSSSHFSKYETKTYSYKGGREMMRQT